MRLGLTYPIFFSRIFPSRQAARRFCASVTASKKTSKILILNLTLLLLLLIRRIFSLCLCSINSPRIEESVKSSGNIAKFWKSIEFRVRERERTDRTIHLFNNEEVIHLRHPDPSATLTGSFSQFLSFFSRTFFSVRVAGSGRQSTPSTEPTYPAGFGRPCRRPSAPPLPHAVTRALSSPDRTRSVLTATPSSRPYVKRQSST